MKTPYDIYIFDLDGTLLNTLTDLHAACNHALQECDMPLRTLDEVRRFVGNGVRKLMERAVPEGTNKEQVEQALICFRRYYLHHSLDTTRPYDGVCDLLDRLHRNGARMAIVSNKLHDATTNLCNRFFGKWIDVAVGEQEDRGIRKKPAPDMVKEALRLLHAEGKRTVYVGDSDVDLMTAENAGLPCISVLWGFRDRDFLLAHGATTLVEKPEEIFPI